MPEFYWEDFFAEVVADLLVGEDVEAVAKRLGKSPNTVLCFAYKSKAANMPNVKQFAEILEYVSRTKPAAVAQALRRLCACFGVVAGTRGTVLRQIAGELEEGGGH